MATLKADLKISSHLCGDIVFMIRVLFRLPSEFQIFTLSLHHIESLDTCMEH
jgi:hypothetical protein